MAGAGRRIEGLRREGTLHVVIDMQRLFAEETEWHAPALAAILPAVTRLVAARPSRTTFARFIPPPRPTLAPGRWRHYYERWTGVTGERLDSALLDLVPSLARLAPAGSTFDKPGYSIFTASDLTGRLARDGIETLVLSGVETDVCVLSSVLDAVDHGIRVVVPVDAVASGSPSAHAAVLDHILPRLGEQVDLCTVDDILDAWLG